MKDTKDKATGDLLKRPVGRPRKFSEPMSNAQKLQARRVRMETLINTGNPENWDVQTCMLALSAKKYSDHHEKAWRQFGLLKGYSF